MKSEHCSVIEIDYAQTIEQKRLNDARESGVPWKKWGPYLSGRQWGTVREDYSENGNAWDYFTHDQAWSRAYRWSEDGLAGISDDRQQLCFAIALWNGRDPILKERLLGVTNSGGCPLVTTSPTGNFFAQKPFRNRSEDARAGLSCSWRATWEGVHDPNALTRESKCKRIWQAIFNSPGVDAQDVTEPWDSFRGEAETLA